MIDAKTLQYLSPETVADAQEQDKLAQGLFIHNWSRILGTWYSISSEPIPTPVRNVTKQELRDKNTFFWQQIIKEILQTNSNSLRDWAHKADINQFLNEEIVKMPYKLGCEILYQHNKYVLKQYTKA